MTNQVTISDPEPKEVANFEDLEFVRILIQENVRLIPKELIEELKGRTFTPEQFYKHLQLQLSIDNPFCLLYAIIDKKKRVRGFLWAEINQLDSTMFINSFSIAKEFWHKGKAMPKVIAFLDSLREKHKCPRVFWITTNDKFFSKHGFKRSKNVLMEYQTK